MLMQLLPALQEEMVIELVLKRTFAPAMAELT